MTSYTVQQFKQFWHVHKDGRFFCTASSETLARKICDSLNGGRTPKVGEFTLADLETLHAAEQSQWRWR